MSKYLIIQPHEPDIQELHSIKAFLMKIYPERYFDTEIQKQVDERNRIGPFYVKS